MGHAVRLSPSLEERYWAKVDKDGPIHPILGTRCWLWTGRSVVKGYGRIFVGWDERGAKVTELAHRFAFRLADLPLADDEMARHRCDNPPCVNPGHLVPGSAAENNRDMWERGRGFTPPAAIGKRYAAKLTQSQVLEIRGLCGHLSQRKIAERYGIGQATVSNIASGWTWNDESTRRGVA